MNRAAALYGDDKAFVQSLKPKTNGQPPSFQAKPPLTRKVLQPQQQMNTQTNLQSQQTAGFPEPQFDAGQLMVRRDEPGDIDAGDLDAFDGQNRQRMQMGLAANQILTDKGITIQRSNKGKLTHWQGAIEIS